MSNTTTDDAHNVLAGWLSGVVAERFAPHVASCKVGRKFAHTRLFYRCPGCGQVHPFYVRISRDDLTDVAPERLGAVLCVCLEQQVRQHHGS